MHSDQAAVGPYSRRLRQLHLAIATLISLLAFSGLIFYFRKSLGLGDAKIALMTAHSIIGYVLIAAVCWRIWLGIKGREPDRFNQVLTGPRNFKKLFAGADGGRSRFRFAGRSPLSRLIATFLYAAVISNIGTGLIFAGTDLYFPPFGSFVLQYVTPEGETPSVEDVRAGRVDAKHLRQVRAFKKPFGKVHFYGGLFILFLASVHAGGALVTEWSAPSDKAARGRARLMLFGPGNAR
ncbi:MAG: cytochrome b/b6 domain-containing protein [Pseudomonadota bacterium]